MQHDDFSDKRRSLRRVPGDGLSADVLDVALGSLFPTGTRRIYLRCPIVGVRAVAPTEECSVPTDLRLLAEDRVPARSMTLSPNSCPKRLAESPSRVGAAALEAQYELLKLNGFRAGTLDGGYVRVRLERLNVFKRRTTVLPMRLPLMPI
jgi:hypothetical protein